MTNNNFSSTAALLWSVADLLRGDFKQSQYGRIILPFTLLRRLECVIEETKSDVLDKYEAVKAMPFEAQDKILTHSAKLSFYNTSKMDLSRLGETNVASNLESYIQSFSPNAREIFEHFDFFNTIDKLEEADLLYKVSKQFANAPLSPEQISNYGMGLVFEELIRRFAESSNETAGEHFTPRDIVRLTTSLVFTNDDAALTQAGLVRSIYDPTAGTGGFLSSGMEYLHELNDQASLSAFGQELNPESYAICKADMLIKGQKVDNIKLGNTLSNDQLRTDKFDYMLSNPPFGVDWKKIQKFISDEHTDKGFEGRFGAGLPRVSDGSLLFLMHLVSKMRPQHEGGSRIGIILNGSPLFTGGAGSGESEIRRYILENDLLEAIVALPTDMFYNTGIATYVWVLSSQKPANRKGKVQLINASKERVKKGGRGRSGGGEVEGNDQDVFYSAMRKSLGSKRKELTEESIETIVKTYGQFAENTFSKIFDYKEFGYRRITVERPLKLAIYPKDELRIEALKADKAWIKLGEALQQVVLEALASFTEEKLLSRDTFLKDFIVKLNGLKLTAAQQKLIVKHLSEHDDEADVCKVKGKVEANADLRDNENVPLTETVEEYFAREVLPHVPDAWIDTKKTDELDGEVGVVGYEIPFNRHFYVYEPPRALEAIDADLDAVSAEIMQLLSEVHS
ncbi:type I restriction-modification system subunit M [Vibrio aestuarianus]|uniref:type I restriction-modification system subunit M n=2 Tax=Vibrio aestuarianus TaxID=28171 RepID=UPI001455EB92|nr:class I SAM-dependent DNA methyltransferase [Vibrio aestuarianus]MDE1213216.1 type I restriction-modification system subunit M [Vibrio aestuarianus]MDE1216584.1 type I restriction-modification system subunit M [Vibrio aestuarianus]MDE1267067.1 type I restriction-modification system subunit M [Vibrio aestuarianus]MDE1274579.1 type I restriction-modification system subunit M [Vibrio aestuarianus]MDE1285059.1 type I restriction-modification system subunit M [Vibrio aestuarianus]